MGPRCCLRKQRALARPASILRSAKLQDMASPLPWRGHGLGCLVACLAILAQVTPSLAVICESYTDAGSCGDVITSSGRCEWRNSQCVTILGGLPPGTVAITGALEVPSAGTAAGTGVGSRPPPPRSRSPPPPRSPAPSPPPPGPFTEAPAPEGERELLDGSDDLLEAAGECSRSAVGSCPPTSVICIARRNRQTHSVLIHLVLVQRFPSRDACSLPTLSARTSPPMTGTPASSKRGGASAPSSGWSRCAGIGGAGVLCVWVLYICLCALLLTECRVSWLPLSWSHREGFAS